MSKHYFIQSKLDGQVIDIHNGSTSPGALIDAYPQQRSDNDNQLWEFVVDPGESGFFFIKSKLNGNVIDIQDASIAPATLLNSNPPKTSDHYSQLWQFLEDPESSGYCYIMSAYYGYVIDVQGASENSGALLQVFPQKPSGTDNQLWRVVGGVFPSVVTAVPAPKSGLGSNSNYFLTDYGNHLTGVSMTLTFEEDFSSTDNGVSFQLNCYSTEEPTITTEWQQFVIYADPGSNELIARVDTWSGTALSDELNRIDTWLATLPSPTIPAGYSLFIELGFDSSNGPGTVAKAIYQAVDNTGKAVGNAEITIVGHPLRTTGQPSTVANLAPIAAFQFNIGAYGGGVNASFSPSWGTVIFGANNTLHVVNSEPKETDFNDGTGETGNVIYGALPDTRSQVFRQWFETTTASAPRRSRAPRPDGRPLHYLPPSDDLSRE